MHVIKPFVGEVLVPCGAALLSLTGAAALAEGLRTAWQTLADALGFGAGSSFASLIKGLLDTAQSAWAYLRATCDAPEPPLPENPYLDFARDFADLRTALAEAQKWQASTGPGKGGLPFGPGVVALLRTRATYLAMFARCEALQCDLPTAQMESYLEEMVLLAMERGDLLFEAQKLAGDIELQVCAGADERRSGSSRRQCFAVVSPPRPKPHGLRGSRDTALGQSLPQRRSEKVFAGGIQNGAFAFSIARGGGQLWCRRRTREGGASRRSQPQSSSPAPRT